MEGKDWTADLLSVSQKLNYKIEINLKRRRAINIH